jgi:hypothetical protein
MAYDPTGAGGAKATVTPRQWIMYALLGALVCAVATWGWSNRSAIGSWFQVQERAVEDKGAALVKAVKSDLAGPVLDAEAPPPTAGATAAPTTSPASPAATPATKAGKAAVPIPATAPAGTGYGREVIPGGPGQPDVHVVTAGDAPDRPQETIVVKGGRGANGNGKSSAPYPYAYPPAPPQPPIPADPNLPGHILGALLLLGFAIVGIEIAGGV